MNLWKILIFVFLIIQRAFAATFVISSDVFEDKRVDPVDFRIIAFKHYYISYNNEPRKFLSAGEYSSLAENESLEFVVNDNQRIPLDTRLSERILTILRTGHQCITYTPGIQVPRLAGSAPPSAYVMYYLKYGFADYSEGLKPKVNYEFIGRQLQPTLSVLQSGDIIVFRNTSLRLESYVFLYLGEDRFLCWDSSCERFYIRGSQHLDDDSLVPNKYIYRVTGIWSYKWPSPEIVLSVARIWQEHHATMQAEKPNSTNVNDFSVPISSTGSDVLTTGTAFSSVKSVSEVEVSPLAKDVKVISEDEKKELKRRRGNESTQRYRRQKKEAKLDLMFENEQLKKEWSELKSQYPRLSDKLQESCQIIAAQSSASEPATILPIPSKPITVTEPDRGKSLKDKDQPSTSGTKGQASGKKSSTKKDSFSQKTKLEQIEAENKDLVYKIDTLKKSILLTSGQEPSRITLAAAVFSAASSQQKTQMGMGSPGTPEETSIRIDPSTSQPSGKLGKRERTSSEKGVVKDSQIQRKIFFKEGAAHDSPHPLSKREEKKIYNRATAQASRDRKKILESNLKKENEEMKEKITHLNKELENKDEKIRNLEQQVQWLTALLPIGESR